MLMATEKIGWVCGKGTEARVYVRLQFTWHDGLSIYYLRKQILVQLGFNAATVCLKNAEQESSLKSPSWQKL
ncbi:hypothetical protein C3733_09030 [Bacillus amyloliquefaciens]|nr:hypothetical protein C3733_09030 [Bacillus amyloliquefaciens]